MAAPAHDEGKRRAHFGEESSRDQTQTTGGPGATLPTGQSLGWLLKPFQGWSRSALSPLARFPPHNLPLQPGSVDPCVRQPHLGSGSPAGRVTLSSSCHTHVLSILRPTSSPKPFLASSAHAKSPGGSLQLCAERRTPGTAASCPVVRGILPRAHLSFLEGTDPSGVSLLKTFLHNTYQDVLDTVIHICRFGKKKLILPIFHFP